MLMYCTYLKEKREREETMQLVLPRSGLVTNAIHLTKYHAIGQAEGFHTPTPTAPRALGARVSSSREEKNASCLPTKRSASGLLSSSAATQNARRGGMRSRS